MEAGRRGETGANVVWHVVEEQKHVLAHAPTHPRPMAVTLVRVWRKTHRTATKTCFVQVEWHVIGYRFSFLDKIAINTSCCWTFLLSVNGGWTTWGNWSTCTVTCDGGTQTRSRSCTNPPAAHGGKPCVGLKENSRDCNKDVFCPGRMIRYRLKVFFFRQNRYQHMLLGFSSFSQWRLDNLGKLEPM